MPVPTRYSRPAPTLYPAGIVRKSHLSRPVFAGFPDRDLTRVTHVAPCNGQQSVPGQAVFATHSVPAFLFIFDLYWVRLWAKLFSIMYLRDLSATLIFPLAGPTSTHCKEQREFSEPCYKLNEARGWARMLAPSHAPHLRRAPSDP